MKHYIAIAFAIAAFFLPGMEALGCSCIWPGAPTEAFRDATAVFVGTVVSVNDADSRMLGEEFRWYDIRTTFSVDEAFKGVKGRKEVDIYTSSQGTACGISFEPGAKVLVYAYGGKNERSFFSTSICTRTRLAEEREDEIALLRSVGKGRMVSRIYGTVNELVRGIDLIDNDYSNDRKPMEGVKIIARSSSNTFRTVSGPDGRFRIVGVPPGTYSIIVDPPKGYKVGGDNWDESTEEEKNFYRDLKVEITATDNPDALSIETRVNGRISGRVFTQDGEAAGKGVRVILITRSTAALEVGDIESVPSYTDKDGKFEFFGLPPGTYLLGFNIDFCPNKNFPYPRWYYPDVPDLAQAVPIILGRAESRDGLTLSLPRKVPEVRLRGKAVDSDGMPVKGAIIETYGLYNRAWREEDGYSREMILQPTFEGRVETDLNGEFELVLLEGNRYRLNPFLSLKDSYKVLLRGEKFEITAKPGMDPLRVVLDKVSEK